MSEFLKIMTFNTQHCLNYREKKIDFEIMANAIRQISPDIVGLQEMRNRGESHKYAEQVRILSELSDFEHFFFAEAIKFDGVNPYGNGLLSKYPILRTEVIPIPEPIPHRYNGYYEARCLLKAYLSEDITVLVCHFGLNPDEAEAAVKVVLENIEDKRCIFMGDLNLTPESPLLLPIRERMNDASSVFKTPLLSFPSDDPICKIDYIFVSPDIAILEADIPPIVASDHRPHTAVIRF